MALKSTPDQAGTSNPTDYLSADHLILSAQEHYGRIIAERVEANWLVIEPITRDLRQATNRGELRQEFEKLETNLTTIFTAAVAENTAYVELRSAREKGKKAFEQAIGNFTQTHENLFGIEHHEIAALIKPEDVNYFLEKALAAGIKNIEDRERGLGGNANDQNADSHKPIISDRELDAAAGKKFGGLTVKRDGHTDSATRQQIEPRPAPEKGGAQVPRAR